MNSFTPLTNHVSDDTLIATMLLGFGGFIAGAQGSHSVKSIKRNLYQNIPNPLNIDAGFKYDISKALNKSINKNRILMGISSSAFFGASLIRHLKVQKEVEEITKKFEKLDKNIF